MTTKDIEALLKKDASMVAASDDKAITEYIESISQYVSNRIAEAHETLTEAAQHQARVNQILIMQRIKALKAATESQ